MVTVVLDPAGRAAAAARRTVHGMDPALRGDDLPLDAGQELLALGQAQTQRAQIGKGVGLGNPHDIGAVFFALSSDADQPHDPGHVASTSAGIQARKYLFRSRAPNLAAVPPAPARVPAGARPPCPARSCSRAPHAPPPSTSPGTASPPPPPIAMPCGRRSALNTSQQG